MTTNEYWREAAQLREQEAHTEAEKHLKQMLKMYDDALEDIEKEIRAIKGSYMKRFGIDEQTADFYLSRELRKYPSDELLQKLLNAGSDEERKAMLNFIHSDGLSTRAYAARTEWLKGVQANISIRMIELETGLRIAGEKARRSTYKNNYYRVIDDTAREIDAGISFSLIDDAAVSEVMDKPWHGKRFSKRIWDNTERLANEAQEIVGRYLVSGMPLDKAAHELANAFEVEKFHATTLVHTETAHARGMSDRKAYEDMGAEEYRYMATLDEVTCDVCGPLDGKYFKLSEAEEGVNFPVMHPRCRCTTTIAMEFGKRRGRNPISGKNEVLPDMTYDEWRQNMTQEERQAFEVAQRSYRNKTADKEQLKRYREVLGAKNVPKSLDEFQNLKYNNSEKYKELKQWYRYENQPYLQGRLDYIMQNGEKNFIPDKSIIKSARTIAGNDSKTPLKDIKRIATYYGGDKAEWMKRVGKVESSNYIFDVHWYERDGKQYEMKLKHRGEKI